MKYFKLDPEMKSKWLTALRSGEYAQGQRGLKYTIDDIASYCCLGVLNEVCNLGYNPSLGFIGIGICYIENDFKVIPMKMQQHLARMNDEGESFSTIANYIEEAL